MVKIAGIQLNCGQSKDENLEQAINLARVACEKEAKIICFQQLFNLPWFPREINEGHFELADEINEEVLSKLIDLAKEKQVILICPLFEKDENQYYNTAAVINHDGKILGKYRKIHVPDLPLWKEKYYFQTGDTGFGVFKTDYADFGIQLCWDSFFPEGFRILALKGAQIVFCPTASAYTPQQQRWKKVMYGHAIANNIYIMRVNRVGEEEKQTFYGNSFCIDPHGDLLGETGDANQGVLICDVDLDEIDKLRQSWTFFQNRQPEYYGDLCRLKE